MANDAVMQSCLVWLAAIVLIVGIYTYSFTKMMATYFLGMFGIAGLLLPDWEFFNRDISRWCYAVSDDDRDSSFRRKSFFLRFRFYLLIVMYTLVYGFGLYKWWMFISN